MTTTKMTGMPDDPNSIQRETAEERFVSLPSRSCSHACACDTRSESFGSFRNGDGEEDSSSSPSSTNMQQQQHQPCDRYRTDTRQRQGRCRRLSQSYTTSYRQRPFLSSLLQEVLFIVVLVLLMMIAVIDMDCSTHVAVGVTAFAPNGIAFRSPPSSPSSHSHAPAAPFGLYTPISSNRHGGGTSSCRISTALCGKKRKKPAGDGTICVNRLAYRNYEILDTLEAGIALLGTEVKSIRDGKMNLRDGFVKVTKNGRTCVLQNVHIGKHTYAGPYYQHEEKRPRNLLVHKQQARKLLQQTEQQGMTVVPIKAYFNKDNKVKIQIALCRGKNVRDKRATIKEREAKREENRIIKSFRV